MLFLRDHSLEPHQTVAIQTQRVEKCSGLREVLLAQMPACCPQSLRASSQPHGIRDGGVLKASKAFWGNPRPWQLISAVSLQVTKAEVLGETVKCILGPRHDVSVLVHFPSWGN